MSVLLFSNNEKTNLANPVANSDTTATLTSTTGLPSPSAGQYFVMSFFDSATGLVTEIIWVTNVSGSVITMVRAQEGTTALNWLAGDIIGNFWTAGQAAAMQQTAQAQGQQANSAVDTGVVNAYVATLSPAPTVHVPGMPIRIVSVLNTNTGASTLNVGLGALPIRAPDGSALVGGEMILGGDYEFLDNSTFYQLSIVTATQTRSGTTPYATDAETVAGTIATKAVVPHGLAAALATVQSVPSGSIITMPLPAVPTGYLACDGASYLRTTYPALNAYLAIGGYLYGSADGTHFNVPDFRGVFLRGYFGALTSAYGTEQLDAIKAHTHTVGFYLDNTPTTGPGHGGTTLSGSTITSGSTGGTETRPINFPVNFCIKT